MTVAQEYFILDYLRKYGDVDSCSGEFHNEFYKKFGGSTKITIYDTKCVIKAMSKLSAMYKDGKINRYKVSYNFKIDKKPSWGYSYWLG